MRILEYLAVTAIALAFTYLFITPIVRMTAESISNSAYLIEHGRPMGQN